MVKRQRDYDEFFEILLSKDDFDQDTILIDFGQATIKSITKIFADATQQGAHAIV